MINPRSPRSEPYYGLLYSQGVNDVYPPEFWLRQQGLVGQINPRERERLKMEHGRYLSGLGDEPDGIGEIDFGGSVGDDPNFPSGELDSLEKMDDNFGSGIFSGTGTDHGRATANSETGVFASNYALPGYVGREVPYTVSRDISDITDDAEVVMVPAGGMYYVEREGRVVDPAVLGPTPRPRKMATRRPPTGRFQPYSRLDLGPAQVALNPNAPVTAPPSYARLPRGNYPQTVSRLPSVPRRTPMPIAPAQQLMPYSSIVTPMAGLGAAGDPPSAMEFALWGGAVGVAAGLSLLAVDAWRKKKPSTRRAR